MFRLLLLAVILTTQVVWTLVVATTYEIVKYHLTGDCTTTPTFLYADEWDNCSSKTCYVDVNNDLVSVDCTTDYKKYMEEFFGDSEYIIQPVFEDNDCSTFGYAMGFYASGTCKAGYNDTLDVGAKFYYVATLGEDESIEIEFFTTANCSSDDSSYINPVSASKSIIDSASCIPADVNSYIYPTGYYWEWYTSNSGDSDSGLSTGAIVGIAVGCFVVLLIIVGIIIYRRHAKAKHSKTLTTTIQTGSMSTLEAALSGKKGLWNDDVITAKRIPRDKVQTKKLISRGAFGEVYSGAYNGQQVAVKVLLPSTRGNLEHVNDFLAEAKMTATMDHPHIVTFIGVAWDSLSDLCVVLEFMDGGDLRTLLDRYKTISHPIGFDQGKTIIALHVCHALTYLHSLLPPIIHRDLKSRNILLNKALEAKLTDFGISRERVDQTMTAGVGTSLWMAPEVMLGEQYDVKADMFSFGVVLSELDVHTLPYAQAKQRNLESEGRQMADATLLQKVTMGEIRVEFSDANPEGLMELGLACVAVEPSERPAAAEALYRLQVILSKL